MMEAFIVSNTKGRKWLFIPVVSQHAPPATGGRNSLAVSTAFDRSTNSGRSQYRGTNDPQTYLEFEVAPNNVTFQAFSKHFPFLSGKHRFLVPAKATYSK